MKNRLSIVARYISILFVLTFGVVSIIGSGGGGDSESNTSSSFTAEMLNASPTYYVTYDGDPDGTTVLGTTQETIVFSGNGPYVVTVTSEYFNESGLSQGTETLQADIVLNADGTLTASVAGEAGETILTLLAETATYLQVRGVNTETWVDIWYFAPPEGWLFPSSGFTAEMLNASPTYYLTYDEAGETVQETLVVSGNGPYVVTVTDEYFDASGVSQRQETVTVDVVLNADGTLTATVQGEAGETILTLLAETATYLQVRGVVDNGVDTWEDNWFFAPPAGWLTPSSGFTAEMLNASPTYYVTYPGDPDGTTIIGKTQETIVFSGTGPYVVTVTTEYFDANGVFQSTNTFDVNVTLNADGTLTAQSSGEPEATIITLTAETATYLLVNGIASATETWEDNWFFAPPAGWL